MIENAKLPKISQNDLLIIYTTGAYGYSMASNYNKLGRPAVVFVKMAMPVSSLKESYENMLDLECNEVINV